MFDAVAAVDSYLKVNGFFTVNEYPIIHRREKGRFQEITDVDVLAVRLPEAGRVLPRPSSDTGAKMANAPELDLEWGRRELIIAEVKEGTARLNTAMFRRPVLREALRRFGASPREELDATVARLAEQGEARLGDGTRVRLVVFASRPPERSSRVPFTFIALRDVIHYLEEYIDRHWDLQTDVPFRDPVLRFMALLQKGIDSDD